MNAKRLLVPVIAAGLLSLAVTASSAFDEIPEQVTIDPLSQYFGAVEFDHEMHTELGEDCSVCHHHTTGTGTSDERCVRCHADSPEVAVVGCSDCHVTSPYSAEQIHREAADVYQFHIDKPGLKAAYHWNCRGCHEAMDGPVGCEDCHALTPEGDAFYHKDALTSTAEQGGHEEAR
ncbi:MAG: cytochrome c3 family protein [Desulfuromonadales bacterium]|jgi:hypothetical protein